MTKALNSDNYRSLESLREYALISHNSKRIIRYTKQTDGSWILMDFIGDKTEIKLVSIECALSFEDVYDKVELEESASQ